METLLDVAFTDVKIHRGNLVKPSQVWASIHSFIHLFIRILINSTPMILVGLAPCLITWQLSGLFDIIQILFLTFCTID